MGMSFPNSGFQSLDLLTSCDLLLHIIWATDDSDHIPASSTPKSVPSQTSEIKKTPFSDHNLQSVCLLAQVLSTIRKIYHLPWQPRDTILSIHQSPPSSFASTFFFSMLILNQVNIDKENYKII